MFTRLPQFDECFPDAPGFKFTKNDMIADGRTFCSWTRNAAMLLGIFPEQRSNIRVRQWSYDCWQKDTSENELPCVFDADNTPIADESVVSGAVCCYDVLIASGYDDKIAANETDIKQLQELGIKREDIFKIRWTRFSNKLMCGLKFDSKDKMYSPLGVLINAHCPHAAFNYCPKRLALQPLPNKSARKMQMLPMIKINDSDKENVAPSNIKVDTTNYVTRNEFETYIKMLPPWVNSVSGCVSDTTHKVISLHENMKDVVDVLKLQQKQIWTMQNAIIDLRTDRDEARSELATVKKEQKRFHAEVSQEMTEVSQEMTSSERASKQLRLDFDKYVSKCTARDEEFDKKYEENCKVWDDSINELYTMVGEELE